MLGILNFIISKRSLLSVNEFYIQKFHEGADPASSHLHRFMKEALRDPGNGVKKAKLTRKWESASKHINRLNLPQDLKRAFFTKSHGSHFQFNGARLSLKSNPHIDLGLILHELRQIHLKSKKSIMALLAKNFSLDKREQFNGRGFYGYLYTVHESTLVPHHSRLHLPQTANRLTSC